MSRDHLRHQAGGNPAQGPTRDMANPTPGPAVGDDFPDAPHATEAPVQDQPDLDAFAERLGLTGDATPGDRRLDGPSTDGNDQRSDDRSLDVVGGRLDALRHRAGTATATGASRLAAGAAAVANSMASRLDRLAERLRPTDRDS